MSPEPGTPRDPRAPRARVVVVGGGITGLTVAHGLLAHLDPGPDGSAGDPGSRDLRPGIEVTVHEAGPRAGGKIAGGPVGPLVVDAGPDGFLARRPEVADLARELGLGDDLVAPAATRPRIWRGGGLHDLPTPSVLGVPLDPDALAATGLVSPAAVDRLRAELDADHPPLVGDASVGAVLRPRIGDEIVDTIVDPLLGGINAGSCDELSIDAGAPALAAAAHAGGSLVRTLAQQAGAAAATPGPVFLGIRGGMVRLVESLVDELGPRLRTDDPVVAIERAPDPADPADGSTWRVRTADGSVLRADAVVVTTPAPVTARLLADVAPGAAAHFAAIEVADVAFVTVVAPRAAVAHPLDGSGFLVARGAHAGSGSDEPLLMTACSWTSSKWAHVTADDSGDRYVAVRVAVGRTDDRRWLELDEATLVRLLLAELEVTIGLRGEPTAVRVTPWMGSLPQYRPGHLERAAAVDALLAAEAPGLLVAGAACHGLGLPACVAQARAVTATLGELLG